ncbi:hypothetical protein BDA96_08G017500 [Sorghum bicolor]|uniref:Uncharacterized protein n=1 Tax=Sorghum bicolor TaxID=4558 RepID=A0A921QD12_SORBI|nr:hypothetical protein BDA96_08G017500 [Sorghum bicolor]
MLGVVVDPPHAVAGLAGSPSPSHQPRHGSRTTDDGGLPSADSASRRWCYWLDRQICEVVKQLAKEATTVVEHSARPHFLRVSFSTRPHYYS